MKKLEDLTKILKALSDNGRIRILFSLRERKDLCVCELRELIGLSQPTISSHLKILENAGLIIYRKDGRWVDYRINTDLDEGTGKLLEQVFSILENVGEIKKDLKKVRRIDRKIICKN